MPVLHQARDLPQAEPATQQPHPLIGERIADVAPVDEDLMGAEAALGHPTEAALAVGEDVEALGDKGAEEPRAPSSAVEDDSDAALTDEDADLIEEHGRVLGRGRDPRAGAP